MEVRVVEGSGGSIFVSDAGDVFAMNHPAYDDSFKRLRRLEPHLYCAYLSVRVPSADWDELDESYFDNLGMDFSKMRGFSNRDYMVHRLVCRAFHGDPPREGMVVDHINGVTTDNRAENLRWLTNRENVMLARWRKRGCPHVFGLDTSTGEVTRFDRWYDAHREGYVRPKSYEAGGGKVMLEPYWLCGHDPLNAYMNNENLIEGYVSEAYGDASLDSVIS